MEIRAYDRNIRYVLMKLPCYQHVQELIACDIHVSVPVGFPIPCFLTKNNIAIALNTFASGNVENFCRNLILNVNYIELFVKK